MRRLTALLIVLGLCLSAGLFWGFQLMMPAKAQANSLKAGVGTPDP